jgi:hypothetical protein
MSALPQEGSGAVGGGQVVGDGYAVPREHASRGSNWGVGRGTQRKGLVGPPPLSAQRDRDSG